MSSREGAVAALARWDKLHALQEHYRNFNDFLVDGMAELGFESTPIQYDIGSWMEHGPQYIMAQAQRGQAKTTIAALYAVWSLIQNPAYRVLIISAGGTQAVEISTLIVRIILTMGVLDCLCPDKMAGDRTSVEAFDVHHSLKGVDKSPSVACVGIDSNLQGKRADLLIPDDIESSKNSATPVQRAKLLHLTKDFTSINSTGRIIWLGTPQTLDSIYNTLASRGVAVRVWPGRYPTVEQRAFYGNKLAPWIIRQLERNPGLATGGGLLGNQGQAVDPIIMPERQLQKKEMDQGEAYFQLQHMLNTTLSDQLRFPLKPSKLILLSTDGVRGPLSVTRGMDKSMLVDFTVCDHAFQLMRPHEISKEIAPWQKMCAYIDPAAGGANGDETAWAIGPFLNGNIHLLSCGGIPGGYDLEKLIALAEVLCMFPLDSLTIEKNMGFGAFREVFTPILRKVQKEKGRVQCEIVDDLVSGQKEARIINTLSPIIGRGSLIIDEAVIDEDRTRAEIYPPSQRITYSLFYQLEKMSLVRGALVHDDRVDALEGLCRGYQEAIALDQSKGLEAQRAKAHAESIRDPLGHKRYVDSSSRGRLSMLRRRR